MTDDLLEIKLDMSNDHEDIWTITNVNKVSFNISKAML